MRNCKQIITLCVCFVLAYSSNFTNAHLATGVCVVVSPGRCNDKRRGVVDEEGEEDAHQQGGQFHHPPHILLPLSPSLHCAAFRGALAVGRPLWPQLLATPAHEADCTRGQRVKLALYLSVCLSIWQHWTRGVHLRSSCREGCCESTDWEFK